MLGPASIDMADAVGIIVQHIPDLLIAYPRHPRMVQARSRQRAPYPACSDTNQERCHACPLIRSSVNDLSIDLDQISDSHMRPTPIVTTLDLRL